MKEITLVLLLVILIMIGLGTVVYTELNTLNLMHPY